MKNIFSLWDTLPIIPGDTLLIHSSLRRILRKNDVSLYEILEYFIKRVGEKGTLLFPTFDITVKPLVEFDVKSSRSKMGALTNLALKDERFIRTTHPLLSFAVFGKYQKELEALISYTGIDKCSVFNFLHQKDAKIAIIDLEENDSMSFYHHVENIIGVPYRWEIPFKCQITLSDGSVVMRDHAFYARRRDEQIITAVNPMGQLLWDKGHYTGQHPGEGHGTRIINCQNVYKETEKIINSGKAKGMLYERTTS